MKIDTFKMDLIKLFIKNLNKYLNPKSLLNYNPQ